MKWKKLGRVFCPDKQSETLISHCMVTVPLHLHDDIFRIYFNARDAQNRSRPHFVEIDINEPQKILKLSKNPVMELGPLGSYTENGVVISDCLKKDGELYFYFGGFPRVANVIFQSFIGLAKSNDNGLTARPVYEGPIKSISKDEPYFSSGSRVLPLDDGGYGMWYTSCDRWEEMPDGSLRHFYDIKFSTSEDGINWAAGTPAITYQNEYEYAFALPSLIKDPDGYKMWYAFRGSKENDTYRIGYATSQEGKFWTRKDSEVGIDVSDEGWDSEMICYPYVFDHNGKRYMLYNGNNYGRTGFGIAVLEED